MDFEGLKASWWTRNMGISVVLGWGLVAAVAAADSIVIEAGGAPQMVSEKGAGEGPAWDPALGLLSSGDGHIMRRANDGSQSVFREKAGSNGLLFDRQGRLLVCQAGDRVVSRITRDGELTKLATGFEGMRFNQPNDLTLDSQGRIYFSDPKYGDRSSIEMLDEQGKQVEGVYRIDADGTVSRIISHEVDRPNGLLITPDDCHLFVADNHNNTVGAARKLWRFDLLPSGEIKAGSRKLVHDWGTARGPDGMAIDVQGRLFVAGGLNQANPPAESNDHKGGVYVFSAEGELIEFIPIPRDEVTNCAFGGKDMKTLYVTAGGSLWQVPMKVSGRPIWPPGEDQDAPR